MTNIIVKMRFGSHLYGTNTPDSDLDIKGVFMPTKEQILLGKIPKSYIENTKSSSEVKNTNEDVDVELYSLHYFIDLAYQGQTVALDMLHAPENMIEEKSYIWDEITSNRKTFYTRNLQSFIGYARKQAAKYGIKGSRLNDAKRVVDFLSNYDPSHRSKIKLSSIWTHLPIGEHIHFIEDSLDGKKQYQVCGKKIQETVTIEYALNIVEKFYKNYGNRAIGAQSMKEEQDIQLGQVLSQIKTVINLFDSVVHGEIKVPGNRIDLLAHFCFKTIRELCNRVEISYEDEIYNHMTDEYIKENLLKTFFKQVKIEDYLEQMLQASERSDECQEPTS